MKVEVWDTYVSRRDGKIMHFDILVESGKSGHDEVIAYGKSYLSTKPFEIDKITVEECKFCHIEEATQPVKDEIIKENYSIIEMENCN